MKKLFFVISLCVVYVCGYAQDNNELIKKLVEKNILTQNEADSLLQNTKLDKSFFPKTTEKIREAFNTPYMQFGGYGLFLYRYSDVDRIKHNVNTRVVFLHVKGELMKNLSYFAMAEFVKPELTEYYVDWTPAKEFNLRIGQMTTLFALENQLSLTILESIHNSRSVSTFAGRADDVLTIQNGKNNIGRDVGVMAYGNLLKMKDFDFIEYKAALYQGTGMNTSETNNSKDFTASVMLQPIKGFRIGGSTYLGEATYIKEGQTDRTDHVRNRWTLASDYKSDRLYARAEWIKANDGGIKKEGIQGMGQWYFIPNKLNSFARIDYLNNNKDIGKEVIDYTLGINYYFYKSCRLQLNYTYSDYSEKWDAPNSNVVAGQMQVVF